MELDEKQRKELGKVHVKIKERIKDNKVIHGLFATASVLLGAILALIAPGLVGFTWLESALTFGLLGVAGAAGITAAGYNKNKKLFNEESNLGYDTYKKAIRTGKIKDYVNELNLSEIRDAKKYAYVSQLDNKDDYSVSRDREDFEREIKAIEKKVSRGQELDADETDKYNKHLLAQAYERKLIEANRTQAEQLTTDIRLGLKKAEKGKQKTADEREAINYLK